MVRKGLRSIKHLVAGVVLVLALGVSFAQSPSVSAQSCGTTTDPSTELGQVTQQINVATPGTYRVWSRLKAPNATANSYFLQIDAGTCAYNVGNLASMPANEWTWVNYQKGDTSNIIDVNLSVGPHTLIYTGREADVQLDRVLLLADTSCVPTGTGDNCAQSDAIDPVVNISSPPAGTEIEVGSAVNIVADASDNVQVDHVDFYVDDVLKGSDNSQPYQYSWDTTGYSEGTHVP